MRTNTVFQDGPRLPRFNPKLTATKAAAELGMTQAEFGALWRKLNIQPERGTNRYGEQYFLWHPWQIAAIKRFLKSKEEDPFYK